MIEDLIVWYPQFVRILCFEITTPSGTQISNPNSFAKGRLLYNNNNQKINSVKKWNNNRFIPSNGKILRYDNFRLHTTKNILKLKSEKIKVDVKNIRAQQIPKCSYKKRVYKLSQPIFQHQDASSNLPLVL